MRDTDNFIDLYLQYTNQTECPTFFHRWCAVTCLSAYLGRSIYFHHGHFTLYPNLYTLLIGSPGTKKSSAIKIGAKLLKQAGYNTFAAKKTRQEKFLVDLAEQSEKKSFASDTGSASGFDILDQNIFGDDSLSTDEASLYEGRAPAECLIAADEFNNFIGLNNLDFISILGELWDYEGVYDYKLKNAKSVFIPDPTISILGGNTPTGMAQAFPPEAIGQGFFSRLLLVYAVPTGVKYTFPPVPDSSLADKLVSMLIDIKQQLSGELSMTPDAMQLVDKIYHKWQHLQDVRFEHYANRRLTHLLKLCLVITAARVGKEITKADVVAANTLLSFTEMLMPKALGEFGKAKNSIHTHKVMELLDRATMPITFKAIWTVLHQDLESRGQLNELLIDLQAADKIQSVGDGFLPKKQIASETFPESVNWNLLTRQERDLAGI